MNSIIVKGTLYISKANQSFTTREVQELAEHAASMNRAFQITGYLYFEKGHFMQYVEGEREHLAQLMKNIRADSRHELLFIDHVSVTSRRFVGWHMQYISPYSYDFLRMEKILLDMARSFRPEQEDLKAFKREKIWDLVDRIAEMHVGNR